jgi:hypothetical protein
LSSAHAPDYSTNMEKDDDRQARLAQALRDNLRRRKAQARAARAADRETPPRDRDR